MSDLVICQNDDVWFGNQWLYHEIQQPSYDRLAKSLVLSFAGQKYLGKSDKVFYERYIKPN